MKDIFNRDEPNTISIDLTPKQSSMVAACICGTFELDAMPKELLEVNIQLLEKLLEHVPTDDQLTENARLTIGKLKLMLEGK